MVVLLLTKHFFGVGWIKAIVIAVLAVIIAIVITAVQVLLGISLLESTFKGVIPGI